MKNIQSPLKTLIIIPAHNEQDNIEKTMQDIQSSLGHFDYLIINDCSTDQTPEILDRNHYRHVDLPVNLGLSGAVQTGYKYAYENGYDCAVQFDGDGQHQARYIQDMEREILNGNDIVIGSRFITQKKNHSMRMIGSRIISSLIKFKTGKKIQDPTSGMRMLNRKMIFDFAYNMNREPEPDTLVHQLRKHKIQIKEIQVEMNEREGGTSMYSNPWNSVKYMASMIISILFLS